MEILVLKQEFAKEDIKLEHHDSAKFEEWLLADQDDLDKRLNSENVKSLIDFKGRSLASFKLLTARDRYRLGAEKVAQGSQKLLLWAVMGDGGKLAVRIHSSKYVSELAQHIMKRIPRLSTSDPTKLELRVRRMGLGESELLPLDAIIRNMVTEGQEIFVKPHVEPSDQKSETPSGIVGSHQYVVTAEQLADQQLWLTAFRESRKVFVPLTTILPQSPPFLLAEARWLCLHSKAKSVSLDDLKAKKNNRTKRKHDLELPYHPLALAIYQGALLGQKDIRCEEEDHRGNVREDLRIMIGSVRKEPVEIKNAYVPARNSVDDQSLAIDANREPLGKLFKCARRYCSDQKEVVTTFMSRIQCFWVVKFSLMDSAAPACEICPSFPEKGIAPELELVPDSILHDLKDRQSLADLLPSAAPTGFHALVRYFENLAHQYNTPPTLLQFVLESPTKQVIDMSAATVLAATSKSMMLRLGENVVKVSSETLIQHEIRIHLAVDEGCPYIRPLVRFGQVKINGQSVLGFLELKGYGEPLGSQHSENISKLFGEAKMAVEHMHRRRVFHRDIKPSNMIVIGGTLQLNDFDVSCFTTETSTGGEAIGTPLFRNPFWTKDYTEADDMNSLVLSFLSLQFEITKSTNGDLLRNCLQMSVSELISEAVCLPRGMDEIDVVH